MERLKEKAILISDGMEVVFPQFTRAGVFNSAKGTRVRYNVRAIVSSHPNMHFSYQNGIYAFIDECNNLYAIPDLTDVYSTLISNGYKTGNFYVPFGWYEKPVDKKMAAIWEVLQEEYRLRLSIGCPNRH